MASNPNVVLKAKFRGCMIGALVGDCLGSPFEIIINMIYKIKKNNGNVFPSKERLDDFMNNLIIGESAKTLFHTDDTRMTLSIAESLAVIGELNAKDMAQRFATDYFNQTRNRGYGKHVKMVFHKLKESNYEDVFIPAKEQFDGTGSYGNGAAMRVAPIALFGNYRGEEYIVNAAKQSALITHAHQDGYRGAILQCLAINAVLGLDSSQELDPVTFVNDLLEKMEKIETEGIKPYCESLKKMKEIFIQNEDYVSPEEITNSLGNGFDLSALKSVPTAVYSFLRGMKPLKNDFKSSNPFMRTIYFAISVGGDTDTITCMAGAIAGAYYGEDVIPDIVQKTCEGIDDVISLADKLFDVTYLNK